MNNQKKIPDAETRARSVANWRETIRKIDALTLALDELIAMVEEHNRNSPLTAYRVGQYKISATEEVEYSNPIRVMSKILLTNKSVGAKHSGINCIKNALTLMSECFAPPSHLTLSTCMIFHNPFRIAIVG